jgi:hypothetical protein
VETKCPLCDLPRPRGAKRCVCNYTFQYDGRIPVSARGRAAANVTGMLVVALGVLGIAIAYPLFERAIPRRDDYFAGGIVLALCGVFTIVASYFGWRWYMATRKARQFVWLFGHRGARGAIAMLGGALLGAGLAMAT